MEEDLIFVYSDESGVFDYIHNDYFLFAGIINFGRNEKEKNARMFAHAENCIRRNRVGELKGSNLSNKDKGKLYRSLNNVFKFCVLIKQKNINRKIFENKKHKQRYLDYAYKIIIKKCLETLIDNNLIHPRKVKIIFINADEHATATDGVYELRESLLMEFKTGTFNQNYEKHFDPIFPSLMDVQVLFCNSKNNFLIRAADIICNHCFHVALENNGDLDQEKNMFIYYLPANYVGHDGLEYFKDDSDNVA